LESSIQVHIIGMDLYDPSNQYAWLQL